MNKSDIAWRWYSSVAKKETGLSPMLRVVFGYIHHAQSDFQRAWAYDALKELQAEQRKLSAAEAETAALRARVAELEAALRPFAYDCPFIVDEATIPHAGIATAPEQVVVNMSVGWLRIDAARAALEPPQ